MRILVVDDAAFMREFISSNLIDVGYDVVGIACDGKEAVEKYIQLKPDIVTMDINMPKMDGIEALEEILKLDKNAKVIMISDIGQHSKIIEAIKKGAVDFIVKPLHPDRLKQSLEKARI
ncbi:two-component system, chemotaxis family, response regulator CheY [Peptoclostridium litorale DSM 5388]|uniref:Stage 0 sporulation protein A homolog n=1 Tax=Peptoclostridium litorale DSM 5388 TaxID=1121324 RepID=A0A069RC60_PEPLI|nr:response regulator [Peptoclostridium litorale]KDR94378.1 chemotaxis protein CheY [Peptoclostridium litorale DSM 5388]SIO24875.1 two-component system, chemotaxis family, response regulator CheY [Peptoclostridium litorale DSM 5388]